jgi:predicted DNA-binding helix-hairpin-helix protein
LLLARRVRRVRTEDLKRLHVPVPKVLPFVVLADHRPGAAPGVQRMVAQAATAQPQQALLF